MGRKLAAATRTGGSSAGVGGVDVSGHEGRGGKAQMRNFQVQRPLMPVPVLWKSRWVDLDLDLDLEKEAPEPGPLGLRLQLRLP